MKTLTLCKSFGLELIENFFGFIFCVLLNPIDRLATPTFPETKLFQL